MTITLLAIIDEARAIGYCGRQPFFIPADLQRFKALTMGHPVIMGRRTFEALPNGPLPHRRNLVLTHRSDYAPAGAEVFHSLETALAACAAAAEVFIIGGGEVYLQALPLAHRLCLTMVEARAEMADTYFPDFDKTLWREVASERHPADAEGHPAFTFAEFLRK